jgi:protein-glutamine gamma-glutamyltransferase
VTSQVTVLDHPHLRPREARPSGWAGERPIVPLAAFAGLAVYGSLRWATMLRPQPVGRLMGLAVMALAIAALRDRWPARHQTVATAVAAGVSGVIAILLLSGIPLSWIVHLRLGTIADTINTGLTALPSVLLPYGGINDPVRSVMVMGAGVLLLDAALLAAFAPRTLGDARQAVAALPLVVLAIVPSVPARPSVPYLHGAILFMLLAAFVWGDRIRRLGSTAAVALVLLATVGALIAAPLVDPHKAWVDMQALTSSLAGGSGESFDWSQGYGPLRWPRSGREVLDVQARVPAYWKAMNLDTFDGHGWVPSPVPAGDAGDVPEAALARWTETLHVTLRGMSSSNVIAAGVAQSPRHVDGLVLPADSAGTWVTTTRLLPGDSYLVTVYAPHPSAAELARAGRRYPSAVMQSDLSLGLPPFTVAQSGVRYSIPAEEVAFASFRSGAGPSVDATGRNATPLIEASPYARAYALARRLASGAATPFAYVSAVEHFLARGFTYNETPRPAGYPLLHFLFASRAGYCQQYAGAMTLLLRMGGVPARVAVGFTTGSYDGTTNQYVVSDADAHAWVEAWFPGFGWVTFDPTPTTAPARGGHTAAGPATAAARRSAAAVAPPQRATPGSGAAGRHAGPRQPSGGSFPTVPLLAGTAGLAAMLLAFTAVRAGRRRRDPLAELECAFARSGQPLDRAVTLASIEARFRSSPQAAAYVRSLRLARFGTGAPSLDAAGRRAVRKELAAGGGSLRRWRALLALPPVPARRPQARRRPPAS